jgi:hypothetical protein
MPEKQAPCLTPRQASEADGNRVPLTLPVLFGRRLARADECERISSAARTKPSVDRTDRTRMDVLGRLPSDY